MDLGSEEVGDKEGQGGVMEGGETEVTYSV